MSALHRSAMEAVLAAAEKDIEETLDEYGIKDKNSEAADDAVLDVAILHAYRVFVRISERQGLTVDGGLFADLAQELAEEMGEETDQAW